MEFPEAILFDLDGVLLDTEPLLASAWRETSRKYDCYLSQDKLNELKGRRKIDCAKKVLEWINKEIAIEELLSTQKLKLSNQLPKAKAFYGAVDLIKFCIKINLPIALVTSSSSESFKIKSSFNPWLNLFKIKILGDEKSISEGKPSPEPYLKAIQRLKVEAKKTWVIEDSYSGSIAALKAGCNLWFFSKDIEILNKLIDEYNQCKIERLNELAEIIYFLKVLKGF
tara:strand:+ start:105 stop:782 length:678 start_codon:yes stop_codon:yes gene_type:complete